MDDGAPTEETTATALAIRDRIKAFRRVPAAAIEPHPDNPWHHSAAQRLALRASLRDVGIATALICYEPTPGHLRLIDGELRREEIGSAAEIPVLVLDVTEAEVDTLLMSFNTVAMLAEQSRERMAALLARTPVSEQLLAAIRATQKNQMASLLGNGVRAGKADPDDVPPVPETPVTQPGDLWVLGEHRVLCGDATREEDVARVMNGQRAVLMNTDPPYGVSYANDDRPNPRGAKPPVAKPRVANDEMRDEQLQAFLEAAFSAAKTHALADAAAWYLWHADLTQAFFAAAAAAANVVLHRQIIWVKPVLLLTRGQYHWKHEPCFFGWVQGHQPPDYGRGGGERDQTTIWEIASVTRKEREIFNHSTPKPTALFAIPLVKHTRAGAVCYEPFAGSGPQFIAAEQLERRCYGLELEPRFCDVIVRRWEAFTGKTAELQRGTPTARPVAVPP